ncbi:DUF1127 domain-containing protein [Pseudomonas sp. dw_358]|uniref:DUF1127 domain-containing protein n=1 Tax=Pseudomonas sp. dw_358 TaxID=2720083 RepID=UPI001BD6A40E|nr:DUF1127 domain-containing protein [Pseudomonas sp. dw_358]
MNGLSDVRVALRSSELDAAAIAPVVSKVRSASGLSRWQLLWMRYTTRRQLLTLDADQLKDIGITRVDARAEGMKPFWR